MKFPGTFFSIAVLLFQKETRAAFFKTSALIKKNFFVLQYNAKRNAGVIPVSNVGHPIDNTIPFKPDWVMIYHDFTAFWIRAASYLLRGAVSAQQKKEAVNFIETIGMLYSYAAEVYSKRMSTTSRPRYFGSFGCIVIQLFDPHLMCIPSLHVMVCICTWTMARKILCAREKSSDAFLAYCFERAVLITESILYLKQHSVNCVSASLYAMRRFDNSVFNNDDAEYFTKALFSCLERHKDIKNAGEIQKHILDLYNDFCGQNENEWTIPLIRFLEEHE